MTDNGLRAALEALEGRCHDGEGLGCESFPCVENVSRAEVLELVSRYQATNSLDDAWRKAESAAEACGWERITVWWNPARTTARATSPNKSDDLYHPRFDDVAGSGSTPAAALNALAERLAERQEAPDGR